IGRGDFAPAPFLRQGEGRLGVDETRISAGQGLGAEVVLLDPAETAARQGGDVRSYDRFEPKVAGLREKDRTEADRESCYARRAFADVGKFMGDPRARMNF